MPIARLVTLALLLLALTVALRFGDEPTLAFSLYGLIPIVLATFWFGLTGGLLTAAIATTLFLGDKLIGPSPEFTPVLLAVATLNRVVVFFGVAVIVAVLLRRERALAGQVRAQREEITELESLRAVLTPSEVPARPHLDVATSFTPAHGLVAGDFFLVVDGPAGSTTIVAGDVVGHGLEAARAAAFVRAALATFARFTGSPVELLQLANSALAEHGKDGAHFVTAVCLSIGPHEEHAVVWASAGHDVPWFLDTGNPLTGGRVGTPLGIGAEALHLEAGHTALRPGAGILLFTDGLTEGRALRRDPGRFLELFGEERARRVVRGNAGAPPARVLEALVAEVSAFSGGRLADDLCLVAVRARSEREQQPTR